MQLKYPERVDGFQLHPLPLSCFTGKVIERPTTDYIMKHEPGIEQLVAKPLGANPIQELQHLWVGLAWEAENA